MTGTTLVTAEPQRLPTPSGTPSHHELVQALARFVAPDTRTGTALMFTDCALYGAGLALAAFGNGLWLQWAGGVIAGLKLCGLSVLGHDAAHGMLTRSRRLNKIFAVLAFTPCLFNDRLWLHAHHTLHHALTNGAPPDIHKPFSWQQYQRMPAWRQRWVRATRSPNPLWQGLYFIVDRLSRVTILSRIYPAAVRRQAIPYTLLTLSYLAALCTWLASRHQFAPGPTLGDIGLVVVVPLLIFHSLTSFVLFLQHTHPRIPWFAPGDPRAHDCPQQERVAHVQMPAALASLMHHSLEHPVHHVMPALPCYRAREAQARLNELIGARAIVVEPSLTAIADIFRRCKLYDYASHRWMDFHGEYTSEPHRAAPGVRSRSLP